MCLKREEAIFTQSGKPQKLVGQFTYLSSNISSTESDVNKKELHVINYIKSVIYPIKSNGIFNKLWLCQY